MIIRTIYHTFARLVIFTDSDAFVFPFSFPIVSPSVPFRSSLHQSAQFPPPLPFLFSHPTDRGPGEAAKFSSNRQSSRPRYRPRVVLDIPPSLLSARGVREFRERNKGSLSLKKRTSLGIRTDQLFGFILPILVSFSFHTERGWARHENDWPYGKK